ncbi:MAG: hypothetical protein OXU37_01540 [Thaumarchaeota archaeon]|nr:hypothetical protein [Nitrososphaerota archaeon]MDD9812948.1 hypothetical protein [Nitrososphaerota archaeon]MDD9843712.1 hypothetical protein [Nitrososphaerota archaeon]RNJ74231.1 MAG: hypothetical protein EB833_01135 [Thaumarchaeota archaeon S13]RNJ75183.1 MAG: hypothetical protein EB824_02095 [Thaumarchaeota archaeon S15]
MDPARAMHTGDTAMLAVTIIIAVVGGALAVTVVLGLVYDLGTLGSLFSVLAVPIAVAIFYAARLLHWGIRRARLAALLDEDRRDRGHVVATVNLCLHLAVGASKSGGSDGAPGLSAMRHVATHVSLIRAQYSHHLSTDGKKIVEWARDVALGALSANTCAQADFDEIAMSLSYLGDEVLPLDDPQLEARRRRAAGIEDPPPE